MKAKTTAGSLAGDATGLGSASAPPLADRGLSGLAVVGYVLALLFPGVGFLVGLSVRGARGQRFHGNGVMLVAALVLALGVTVQLLSRG